MDNKASGLMEVIIDGVKVQREFYCNSDPRFGNRKIPIVESNLIDVTAIDDHIPRYITAGFD